MKTQVNVNEYKHGSSHKSLNILVVGATGGTGRATVEKLLSEGHRVTAYSRSANQLIDDSGRLVTINGNVTDSVELDRAIQGQQVIIVTLGINENPLRVRFFGSARTTNDVRSMGTRNVITAMRKHGVQRLVVQSSFGVGETRGLLGFVDQLFFNLILKPQIDDTEAQEKEVRNSGLDWTIAQPVHLTDEDSGVFPFLSTKGQTRLMKVARKSVANFLRLPPMNRVTLASLSLSLVRRCLMLDLISFSIAIAAVVMAGVFFAFSSFVMTALGNIAPAEGIKAMQRINIDVFCWSFSLLFFGIPLASLGLGGNGQGRVRFITLWAVLCISQVVLV